MEVDETMGPAMAAAMIAASSKARAVARLAKEVAARAIRIRIVANVKKKWTEIIQWRSRDARETRLLCKGEREGMHLPYVLHLDYILLT